MTELTHKTLMRFLEGYYEDEPFGFHHVDDALVEQIKEFGCTTVERLQELFERSENAVLQLEQAMANMRPGTARTLMPVIDRIRWAKAVVDANTLNELPATFRALVQHE